MSTLFVSRVLLDEPYQPCARTLADEIAGRDPVLAYTLDMIRRGP